MDTGRVIPCCWSRKEPVASAIDVDTAIIGWIQDVKKPTHLQYWPMGQQQEMALLNQSGQPPSAGMHPPDPSVHGTNSYPDKNQYHQVH
eukprot:scaffold60728_cov62-Attheya_sp.AAC.1